MLKVPPVKNFCRDTTSDDFVERLFNGCKVEHFPAGRSIFLQGDAGSRVYGVLQGEVDITIYERSGRKIVAKLEKAPTVVGEISGIDNKPRIVSAICATNCTVVSLTNEQMVQRLQNDSDLSMGMMLFLCQRLRMISVKLSDQVLLKIEPRLAKCLLELHQTQELHDDFIKISQAKLADMMSVTRESINKTLGEWQRENILTIKRGAVRIDHIERIKLIASR